MTNTGGISHLAVTCFAKSWLDCPCGRWPVICGEHLCGFTSLRLFCRVKWHENHFSGNATYRDLASNCRRRIKKLDCRQLYGARDPRTSPPLDIAPCSARL